MANGANRLFDVIKNTSEETQPTQAQYVTLTVKSLNPLIFDKDNRLDITREFCIFDTTFDFSTIHVDDIIGAILLNNGQLYYICVNLSLDKTVAERLNEAQTGSETLPVGSEIDYDGRDIPTGWQQVNDPKEYSTNEQKIGTWIDGKPIYRKVIDFGALPNNTFKRVPHGISNPDKFVHIGGYAVFGTIYYPLPLQYKGEDSSFNAELYADSTNVVMSTNRDRTAISAYVIIEYTKTTD